jgi:beta-glucosidase
MKRFLKVIAYILLSVVGVIVLAFLVFNGYYAQLNSKAKKELTEVQRIKENGFQFRDLNKNGKLDVYEDSRQEIEKRIDDLLVQMNLEEKVGMMWHPPIGVGSKGEVLGKPNPSVLNFVSSWDVIVNKKINHYNLFTIPDAQNLAGWYNRIQKLAAETGPLEFEQPFIPWPIWRPNLAGQE